MNGSRLALVVASILAISWLTILPARALACNPGRTPSSSPAGFSGTQRGSISGLYGVKSKIEVYTPSYVQEYARSWVWNMLTKPGIPGGQQWWAQTGWATKHVGQWYYSPVVFISWTDNVGNYYLIDTFGSAASTYTYYTYWIKSTKQFRFFRDSTELGLKAGGWTPSNAQQYGETHNTNNQMPGDTNNKDRLAAAGYIVTGEASWRSMATDAGANNAAWYGATKVNNYTYDIWDKFCSASGGN